MYISGLIKKCLGFYLVEFEKGLHEELLNLPHKKLVNILDDHRTGIDIRYSWWEFQDLPLLLLLASLLIRFRSALKASFSQWSQEHNSIRAFGLSGALFFGWFGS